MGDGGHRVGSTEKGKAGQRIDLGSFNRNLNEHKHVLWGERK